MEAGVETEDERFIMVTHPGLQEGPIYLDYNATTPVDPLVATTLSPFLSTYFGNPSSGHSYGRGGCKFLCASAKIRLESMGE